MKLLTETAKTVMSARLPLTHLCPFYDETDVGEIQIVWRTGVVTPELHQLANYLSNFEQTPISHEALTARIADQLTTDGLDIVRVTTYWQTAGMDIECSTLPTPAAGK